MSTEKPIPVRLTQDIIHRLDNAVKKMGLSTRTAVIKLCLANFLDYFEKNGVADLPFNWKEIIHNFDGRSQRHKHHSHPVEIVFDKTPREFLGKLVYSERLEKLKRSQQKHT